MTSEPAEADRLGDLPARVLVAVPAAALLVAGVAVGGTAFAVGLALVAAVAASEAYGLLGVPGRARVVGAAAAAALPVAALAYGERGMLAVAVCSLPLAFVAAPEPRRAAVDAIARTVLGVAWVGVPLAHGVLLRELAQGEALVIAVLVGTFVGDTAAHLVGATLGRRQLAPRLSPAKTVEGLVAGVVVGTLSVWAFGLLSQEWLTAPQALAIGLAVSLAAPVGDLFESLVKRAAGVKDSGRLLGPHGGLLDRIDAVLFAAVAGFYASLVVT